MKDLSCEAIEIYIEDTALTWNIIQKNENSCKFQYVMLRLLLSNKTAIGKLENEQDMWI